jgi:hypothetical protein
MRRFQVYPTHGVAKLSGCPLCHRTLRDQTHHETDRSWGGGHFKLKCPECGFAKWYDLAEACTPQEFFSEANTTA